VKINFRLIASSRRRRIALRVAPDGVLEVLAPVGVAAAEAEQLILRHSAIVNRLVSRFQKTTPSVLQEGSLCLYRGEAYPVKLTHRITAFDGKFLLPAGTPEAMQLALETLYRKLAAVYFTRRVPELAARCGVTLSEVAVSGARQRYGSCTARGKCSFSWRLIQYPDDLIDYVICHELAHRREMNHSAAFYRVLESFYPDEETARRRLAEFTATHKLY